MSKTLSILWVVAIAAVAVAPRASAGDVKAEVPFPFVVAGQPLPSGEYRFQLDETTRLVHVYLKARHVAVTMCQLTPSATREAQLVFHRHAGQRFLKAVSTGHGFVVALPTSPTEIAAQKSDTLGRPIAGMQ
jgi:hypothetical protein